MWVVVLLPVVVLLLVAAFVLTSQPLRKEYQPAACDGLRPVSPSGGTAIGGRTDRYADFYRLARFLAEEELYDLMFLLPVGEDKVEFHINLNDAFHYATADSCPLSAADIPLLRECLRVCRRYDEIEGDKYACLLFATCRRGRLPLKDRLPAGGHLQEVFRRAAAGNFPRKRPMLK